MHSYIAHINTDSVLNALYNIMNITPSFDLIPHVTLPRESQRNHFGSVSAHRLYTNVLSTG